MDKIILPNKGKHSLPIYHVDLSDDDVYRRNLFICPIFRLETKKKKRERICTMHFVGKNKIKRKKTCDVKTCKLWDFLERLLQKGEN